MSKPIKQLIEKSYEAQFSALTGAVLIGTRGIKSNENNTLRARLASKQIKVTVVKNALARRIFKDSSMAPANELIDGATALVYAVSDDVSVVSAARELLQIAKEIQQLEFKGAVMDGIQFGPDDIKALSEYPTKEEAQANLLTLLLSPARNLAGAIGSPAAKLAGIIEAISEKLEKGETITKVA